MIEGNTYSLLETETLLKEGIRAKGKTLAQAPKTHNAPLAPDSNLCPNRPVMSEIRYMGVMNTIRRDPEIVFRGLRSFFKQSPPPELVYFIDQNPQKMQLPDDLAANPKIIHHHEQVPSVGLARNSIPKTIAQDWILFCDDDGFLADDYVHELAQILANKPDLELVAGPYIHDTDGKYYSVRHQIGGRLNTILGSKLLLGSNICIRPQLFNRIGRYDTRFGPGSNFPSSDETDLCWKSLSAGANMLYSPRLRVFHPPAHSASTPEAVQKAFRYGRGKGALAAKWMFERPSILGYWEFIEMNLVPVVNAFTGCAQGDFRQIQIQWNVLKGRYQGFFEFVRLLKKGSS